MAIHADCRYIGGNQPWRPVEPVPTATPTSLFAGRSPARMEEPVEPYHSTLLNRRESFVELLRSEAWHGGLHALLVHGIQELRAYVQPLVFEEVCGTRTTATRPRPMWPQWSTSDILSQRILERNTVATISSRHVAARTGVAPSPRQLTKLEMYVSFMPHSSLFLDCAPH